MAKRLTTLDTDSRLGRSSEHSLLCVPRTRRHWGDRAFSVATPSLWNALPHHLTLSSMTTAAFKVKLKTFIYKNILYSALSNERWNSAIEM